MITGSSAAKGTDRFHGARMLTLAQIRRLLAKAGVLDDLEGEHPRIEGELPDVADGVKRLLPLDVSQRLVSALGCLVESAATGHASDCHATESTSRDVERCQVEDARPGQPDVVGVEDTGVTPSFTAGDTLSTRLAPSP